MPDMDAQKEWEEYTRRELAFLSPLLAGAGFVLDDEQPHTIGERFLMQAVTTKSGKKLILLGKRAKDGKRVVIKASRDEAGRRELEHERECRRILKEIDFAYDVFLAPEEVFFGERGGSMLSIQEFIPQEKPFLERSLREQFELALKAFKAQESAHATTYRHLRLVRGSFGAMDAGGYLASFEGFRKEILGKRPDPSLTALLRNAAGFLSENREALDQYAGFLTHVDFVPHNIRIRGSDMYLLDHSSLRFGNKYEGWARFLNFMALHNPDLERALVKYVADNRTPEESLSLRLMRIYRLGEILLYYTRAAERSSGDLRKLNDRRVAFWAQVLEATLADRRVSLEIVESYRRDRDALRSEEEKERQIGLH